MAKPENFIAGMNQMITLSGKSREHVSRSVKKYYGITITDIIAAFKVSAIFIEYSKKEMLFHLMYLEVIIKPAHVHHLIKKIQNQSPKN